MPPRPRSKFIKAINKGLLKIFSKMGISTVQSYCGAQIFEAIGLNHDLIDRYFTGTPSRIEGIGIDEIGEETLRRHAMAYRSGSDPAARLRRGIPLPRPGRAPQLEPGDDLRSSSTPPKRTTRRPTRNLRHWSTTRASVASESARDCSSFTVRRTPIPLDEVEPAPRSSSGSPPGRCRSARISKEAHETLAIAMNRIGGKSNTGEGGEDPERFIPLPNGDSKNSAIKQVASARFGVTTHYLVNARELQIKMAQGAKPGEGGQLPGHKVDETIARLRYSTPGVQLISPPPHHDIYSIEDLAQLIFDLKNANPEADISVKLVAEVGVGTVAAGVAKAHADKILISGDSGGTGASPLSSIKYAGIPWELGLGRNAADPGPE